MSIKLITTLTSLVFLVLGCGLKTCDQKKWSPEMNIKLEDYQGQPKENSHETIIFIQTGIWTHFESNDEKPKFCLITFFSKSRSWIIPVKRWKYPETLEFHFRWQKLYVDLIEVYTRLLRKRILNKTVELGNQKDLESLAYNYQELALQEWESLTPANTNVSDIDNEHYQKVKRHIHAKLDALNEFDLLSNTISCSMDCEK